MIVESLGRFFDVYRRTAWTRTAITLVLANAIPLVGVLFFDWSLLTILVVYWVENAIVGLWNVPKIMVAQGSIVPVGTDVPPTSKAASLIGTTMPSAGRVVMALFFLLHYGAFWVGHGIFVFALPRFGAFDGGGGRPTPSVCDDLFAQSFAFCPSGPFGEVVWSSVAIAAVALFLSHGASFFLNYLGRGEYLRASPTRQMGSVYGRVFVLHLTILLGAFVAALLGAPIGVLLILVVLKTAFDLRLHLNEHRGTLLTAA